MAASDYRLLLAAQTGAEAFVRRALELLTADVRELALLALTEWQQAGIATPELLPSLAALQNPTWGTWNGLLQVILEARQRALATGAAAEREKAGRSAALAALADLWHRNLDDAPGGGGILSFGKSVEQAIQTGMHAEMERNWEEARRDLRPLLTFMVGDPLAVLRASTPGSAAAPPSNAGVSPAALVTTPAFSALLGRPDLPQRDLQRLFQRHAPENFPGILLGDFLVGRPVGEGGFGTVHIARQVSTGRKVAVKLLHDGMPAEIRARFQREAAYLARFNHPHIVGVLAYGQARWVAPLPGAATPEPWMETFTRSAPEKTFIAMEWIEGQTFEAIFRQAKADPTSRPDVRTLAEWFAQAAKPSMPPTSSTATSSPPT